MTSSAYLRESKKIVMNTEDALTGTSKAGRCQPYDLVSHGSTSSGKNQSQSVKRNEKEDGV